LETVQPNFPQIYAAIIPPAPLCSRSYFYGHVLSPPPSCYLLRGRINKAFFNRFFSGCIATEQHDWSCFPDLIRLVYYAFLRTSAGYSTESTDSKTGNRKQHVLAISVLPGLVSHRNLAYLVLSNRRGSGVILFLRSSPEHLPRDDLLVSGIKRNLLCWVLFRAYVRHLLPRPNHGLKRVERGNHDAQFRCGPARKHRIGS